MFPIYGLNLKTLWLFIFFYMPSFSWLFLMLFPNEGVQIEILTENIAAGFYFDKIKIAVTQSDLVYCQYMYDMSHLLLKWLKQMY